MNSRLGMRDVDRDCSRSKRWTTLSLIWTMPRTSTSGDFHISRYFVGCNGIKLHEIKPIRFTLRWKILDDYGCVAFTALKTPHRQSPSWAERKLVQVLDTRDTYELSTDKQMMIVFILVMTESSSIELKALPWAESVAQSCMSDGW